jgi:small nuclear ribonucleoprotein (snRNP)-like protein
MVREAVCSKGFMKIVGTALQAMLSPPSPSPPPSSVHSPSNVSSTKKLNHLLRQTLRITITDGRIFLGTFVGTDQPLNIILVNTEEFRLGYGETPVGRYVGQVMIPWKLVVKAEVKRNRDYTQPELDDDLYT